MNAALLPVFGGGLHESWELHELRLLSWLRIHQIQQDMNHDKLKIDCLVLSLKPNSPPLSWFNSQPDDLKSDFPRAIDLLRKKFGSDLRKEMQRISALNCLQVRSFRDSEHKTEMVFELITELEQLLTCGSVDQDVQRREYLLRCFRGFSGALKMMNRTTSYDGALLAALNWESSVISKAEEAMIQAGIKRQLKSQNAEARTKRKSNSARPVNTSNQRETTSETPHANFTTQDFQAHADPIRLHPDVYFKTHPPSGSGSGSHQQKPFQSSSHALQQRLDDIVDQSNQETWHRAQNGASHAIGGNASSASATAFITPPAREETDPSQMMESLVDPHMGSDQFNRRAQRMDEQSNSYEHLGQMNQNEQEVLNHASRAEPPPHKIKPLIYDPKKNPYPPPEQLPENRHPAQTRFLSIPVPNPSGSQEQVNSYNRPVNSSQPNLIPFPSAGVGSGALPSFQPSRQSPNPPTANEAQPSEMMLPGASCSTKNSVNLPAAQYSFQRRSGSNSPAPQRRTSKLVKLRRNASSSSNNSSVGRVSNSGSLGQIRHFISSIHNNSRRRRSQASHSGDESDISSTQEQAIPHTPSSMERGGGNGSGMESDGNERMRPMQVQFSRLFRKHNHPEHVRQAHRAMLLDRYRPPPAAAAAGGEQQKRDKGKARAVDVNSAASGTVREFLARRGRDPAGSGAKSSLHSSPPLHATRARA